MSLPLPQRPSSTGVQVRAFGNVKLEGERQQGEEVEYNHKVIDVAISLQFL